jgi:hypothetical protein
MKTYLILPLLILSFSVHAKKFEYFVPYNFDTPSAKAKQSMVAELHASMLPSDRIALKAISKKYTDLVVSERAKNTPLASRATIEKLKMDQFNELISSLSPSAVGAIMNTRRELGRN